MQFDDMFTGRWITQIIVADNQFGGMPDPENVLGITVRSNSKTSIAHNRRALTGIKIAESTRLATTVYILADTAKFRVNNEVFLVRETGLDSLNTSIKITDNP